MFSPAGSRAASNTRAKIREARRIVVQAQGRGTLVDFGIGIVNSAGLEIDVYASLSGLGCSVKGVASCGNGVGRCCELRRRGVGTNARHRECRPLTSYSAVGHYPGWGL